MLIEMPEGDSYNLFKEMGQNIHHIHSKCTMAYGTTSYNLPSLQHLAIHPNMVLMNISHAFQRQLNMNSGSRGLGILSNVPWALSTPIWWHPLHGHHFYKCNSCLHRKMMWCPYWALENSAYNTHCWCYLSEWNHQMSQSVTRANNATCCQTRTWVVFCS